MVSEKIDAKSYTNLLIALEENTCALILGPEFFLLNNPDACASFRDMIYEMKLSQNPYVEEDGFFNTHRFQGLEDKSSILNDLKSYFREIDVPDYYNQVAQLPFSLCISLSPDNLLAKAMAAINRPHHFCYYKKESGLYMKEAEKPKWEQRNINEKEMESEDAFLFNFLGIYSDTQSMIFTYDVFFEFLYNTFLFINNDQSSNNLRTIINRPTQFLFLGFSYDKWYLKLIFFTLEKILSSQKSLKTFTIHDNARLSNTVQFYENQFQLNFYNESTLDFIDRLYTDCKRRGILKEPRQQTPLQQQATASAYKILFFASNPHSLIPLNNVAEYKKIREAHIQLPNEQRDQFTVAEMQQATTQKNLLLKIKPERPSLVVISMHGSKDTGLLFQNENGGSEPLSLQKFLSDLKTLLDDPQNKLQCVVFSCCHTAEFAEQAARHIPYAIGIRGAIQDEAMPEFMEGFFNSLFTDGNVKHAFKMGRHMVERNDDLKEYASMIEFYSHQ